MKFACVFPGQGSQAVGMMAELAEQHSEVKELYARASEALAYDLWEIVSQGPAEELNNTECTQPAMLTAGVAAWKILRKSTDEQPVIMAGHSLGEYTALVCAGTLKFEDAVKLVASRGRLMQEAVPEGAGSMAAILGLDDDSVKAVCEQASDNTFVVQAVNFNSPGQVVIAGNTEAVEKAMLLAKESKAKRAIKLPVSVPSHSSLMESAADHLGGILADIEIKAPATPVVQNVDAKAHSDIKYIASGLQKQLHNPVLWVDTVNSIIAQDIDVIIECGPGRVLAGLNRRINKSVPNYTIDNVDNLAKLVQALNESTTSL
jgi:[acyl-carrier-protein] S-malonyltransferase